MLELFPLKKTNTHIQTHQKRVLGGNDRNTQHFQFSSILGAFQLFAAFELNGQYIKQYDDIAPQRPLSARLCATAYREAFCCGHCSIGFPFQQLAHRVYSNIAPLKLYTNHDERGKIYTRTTGLNCRLLCI